MSPSGDSWLSSFTEEWDEDERPGGKADPVEHTADRAGESQPEVRVGVDEGGMVATLALDPAWRAALEPRQLGPAVVDAANAALGAWFVEQTEQGILPTLGGYQPPVSGASNEVLSVQQARAEIASLFERWPADFAQFKRQLESAAQASFTGAAADGRAVVTMTRGQFVAVEVDFAWAARARFTEIEVELTRALRSAQQAAAAGGAGSVRPPGAVARVMELTQDPQALLRRLGMPG